MRPVARPMLDQPVHQVARAGMRNILHRGADVDHGIALHHAELEIIEIDQLHPVILTSCAGFSPKSVGLLPCQCRRTEVVSGMAAARIARQPDTIARTRRDRLPRSNGLVIISMPGCRKPSAIATLSA